MMKLWLALLAHSAVWAAALVLSVALIAVSTSLVSSLCYMLAALVAAKHLINGPFASN